mmetsp:Transcript_3/g.1  ORF Transcript_3/g.1 Transcript_3/m.1 type:complete len:309 (+) Transcript_3:156-1082(+)
MPLALWALVYSLTHALMPRMPMYQISSFRLVMLSTSLSSFRDISLKVKLSAGIMVKNPNFVGASIYDTIIDVYYPDWYGELQHIGALRQIKSCSRFLQNGLRNIDEASLNASADFKNFKTETEKNKYEQCMTRSGNPSRHNPFFVVDPLKTTVSQKDLLSLLIQNLALKTIFNLFYNALRGIFQTCRQHEIIITGAVQVDVKFPLGISIPATIGIACDNYFNLMSGEFKIFSNNCKVENIALGWNLDMLEKISKKMKEKKKKSFLKLQTKQVYEKGQCISQVHNDDHIPLNSMISAIISESMSNLYLF